MIKNLYEYVVETDMEYKVTILSIDDIKEPETQRRMLTVLDRYGATDVEIFDEVASRTPKEFPGVEFAFISKVEAVLKSIPESGAGSIADMISLETQIPRSSLHVNVDGTDEVDVYDAGLCDDCDNEDYKPVVSSDYGDASADYIVNGAQDLVGQKSLKTLIDKMKREDLKNIRDEQERVRKFVTSHMGIKDILGENKRAGFYICKYKNGKVLVESGPEKTRDTRYSLVKDRTDLRKIMIVLGETEESDDVSTEDRKTDYERKVAREIKEQLRVMGTNGFSDVVISYDTDENTASIDMNSIDIDHPSLRVLSSALMSVAVSDDSIIPYGRFWIFTPQPRFTK
mgnify:CR=1 FL=1